MKKIVVVYPYETGDNAFSGGVPKVIVSNLIAIKRNGDIPYLILPRDNKGLISFLDNEHPYCKVIPVKFKSLSLFSDTKGLSKYFSIYRNLKGFIHGKWQLKKEINKITPDVIHFHEVINFPLLNIFPKAKIVLHLHSYRFTSYGKILGFILRSINKHANVVISPTQSIIDAISDKLTVEWKIVNTPYLNLEVGFLSSVQNSVALELLQYHKSEKIIFSFVGRICSIKRINHFIAAISRLDANTRSRVVFSIIGGTNTEGDRSYKAELEKEIALFKLEDIVKFHGYVNPIESILPYIDYGVILSESEAVPMIGIEYMRFNIPILGYNAPGISDFLVNDKNGYLLENGSVDKLVDMLELILTDRLDTNDFDKTIPKIFKRHTINVFSERLKEIYEA